MPGQALKIDRRQVVASAAAAVRDNGDQPYRLAVQAQLGLQRGRRDGIQFDGARCGINVRACAEAGRHSAHRT